MKALSIAQPYASLIIWGARYSPGVDHGDGLIFAEATRRWKPIENRRWATSYRGPLLIHAAKTKRWMPTWRGPAVDPMPFGQIIGRAKLVQCLPIARLAKHAPLGRYEWVRECEHAEGPWLWILLEPEALEEPIDYTGSLGLFDVPDELLADAEWTPTQPQGERE